jgi:hypothetical protein
MGPRCDNRGQYAKCDIWGRLQGHISEKGTSRDTTVKLALEKGTPRDTIVCQMNLVLLITLSFVDGLRKHDR